MLQTYRLLCIGLISLSLLGCSSIPPQRAKFPEPPQTLMQPPSELAPLPKDPLQLSIIVDSVKNNYATSFSNSIQLISLQDWIKQQQTLFNKP